MADKHERLGEIIRRLNAAAPFSDGALARSELERIMREVEDELTDIPFNPDAAYAPPDGRMYPPHEIYERASGHIDVRFFLHKRHRTWIGKNGALKFASAEGSVDLDLPGADGQTIANLLEAK